MPAPKNTVYVIRCLQSGAHKIGITGDWDRRSRQLEVGSKTATVRVVRVNDGPQLEKWLHKRYKAVRLPQTEWFHLSADQLEHVLAALEKASSDHQAAAKPQRQPARQVTAQSKPAPAATPAADNAAAWRARQAREQLIRAAHAQAAHNRRINKAFPFWYFASFSLIAFLIAGSVKSAYGSTGEALALGAINSIFLAFPVAYVLAAATTNKKH